MATQTDILRVTDSMFCGDTMIPAQQQPARKRNGEMKELLCIAAVIVLSIVVAHGLRIGVYELAKRLPPQSNQP